VPCLGNQSQQKEPERPLGDSHAHNGKCLPDGFEKNGFDKVLGVGNVGHALAKAVMGSNGR
jgi:hypothetical protein